MFRITSVSKSLASRSRRARASVALLATRDPARSNSQNSYPHCPPLLSHHGLGGGAGAFNPMFTRQFSSSPSNDGEANPNATTTTELSYGGDTTSVDDTLNKLFEESSADAAAAAGTDASWYSSAGIDQFEPSAWWNVADHAVSAIIQTHDITGLPFGWSIVATTLGLRLLMFPFMGLAQQTTSRMVHLSPELKQLQAQMERLGTPTREEQLQFGNQYKALFRKYKVKPRWIMIPMLQLPLFGGLFFGLKKMPALFPDEFSNAGMFWFPDLTVPDPMYILPMISTITMLAMFETNKEQMLRQTPGAQGQFMLNFFRGMGVISFPVVIGFDASVVLMWATNSCFMFGQNLLFKTKAFKRLFGIWDPPKNAPPTTDKGIAGSFGDMVKRVQGEPVTDKDIITRHNKRVETKKSFRLARERRKRSSGITGKKNI